MSESSWWRTGGVGLTHRRRDIARVPALVPALLVLAAGALGPLSTFAQLPAPSAAAPGAAGAARPIVGLVLGGGGARGAAHIGVLDVLERLRIPVDCVAGTSMGALVAGAWAAGLSTAEMREELGRADWGDLFIDNPGYGEQHFRSRQLAQRYLPGSETGLLTDGGAVTPPGVVSGQKIKLFFNRLVRANTGEPELQVLPLPVSIIATDIGTGDRVVFRDGSLTQAMRASMSVPGLMAPLEYRARKLVDGGLVDNVPIREVRERCGAQVVIVINVGSPPLPPESISGLLSITAQMIALLTEQNVSASLASLGERDIYIKPDMGSITAADFNRHLEAAARGQAAAEGQAERLAALSVDEASYAAWRRRMAVRQRDLPRVDEIQIADTLRTDPAVLRRWVEQPLGQPLDTDRLGRDLLRAYGDGWYERVDYSVYTTQRGRNILTITPVEKSWGPDYLRLGVRFESSLGQGSTYLLRAGYHRTWINDLGGELLFNADLGSSSGLSADWYQPLTRDQRVFAELQGGYATERTDYYFGKQRIAQYSSGRTEAGLSLGLNLPLLGQLRLGWRETRISDKLETGVDVLSLLPGSERRSGWLLGLDLDRLDQLYFPQSGWALRGQWLDAQRQGYARLHLEGRAATTLGGVVLGSRLSWVDSPRGQLPVFDAGRLGGFLNLTGFAKGQLIGDGVGYAHVRAERIIGRLPAGLRGDMRLGVALEAGRVGHPYTPQQREGWLNSVALYLGGATPLGPAYIGIGRGSAGSTNAYLFIGTP